MEQLDKTAFAGSCNSQHTTHQETSNLESGNVKKAALRFDAFVRFGASL
jgi:hypothetical protein